MFAKGKLWLVWTRLCYFIAFILISLIAFSYLSISSVPESLVGSVRLISSEDAQKDMIGTAEWFLEREGIYRDRNRRIENVCSNLLKFSETGLHLYKSPTQGNSFWFDLSHHLAVCMHPKV